jgi:hypothetical protein
MSKRDIAQLTPEQVAKGKALWARTNKIGRVTQQSVDHEAMAPKTWIRYMAPKGQEICVIECELYAVPRTSGAPGETVGMINGMCPVCGETFIAREDNKALALGSVSYQNAPKWLRVHWEHRCKQLGKPPMDADKIPLVSSPERWACDYCKGWCVKVTDGIACDDHKGNLPTVIVSMHTPIVGGTAPAEASSEDTTSGKIII